MKFGNMTHFGQWRILAVSILSTVKIPNFKSKMAGDRRFRKQLNRRSSAMVQHIAMKFGIMTHFNTGKPTHDQNLDF